MGSPDLEVWLTAMCAFGLIAAVMAVFGAMLTRKQARERLQYEEDQRAWRRAMAKGGGPIFKRIDRP